MTGPKSEQSDFDVAALFDALDVQRREPGPWHLDIQPVCSFRIGQLARNLDFTQNPPGRGFERYGLFSTFMMGSREDA